MCVCNLIFMIHLEEKGTGRKDKQNIAIYPSEVYL